MMNLSGNTTRARARSGSYSIGKSTVWPFLVAFILFGVTGAGADPVEDQRPVLEKQFAEEARVQKEEALRVARAQGWKIRGLTEEGRFYELQEIADGHPVYYMTDNANAAISTGANLIRQTSPYNLTGDGHTVGVWDGGAVLSTHQEFDDAGTSRVHVMDGASSNYHATHVGGTIGASGVQANAKGMAPEVSIDSYDWSFDESEMAFRGAAVSGEAGKLNLSNHSYGTVTGWANGSWSGNSGPHWWGTNHGTDREDDGFGQYNSTAADWDAICYAAPYYLPFKSAGNDRNDSAPSLGSTYYYYSGGWQSATYNSTSSPFADGFDSGYDTIPTYGVAKNILTIGAVNDAVSGGLRDPASGTMSSFSGWGPADDGRIKPDIVANGVSLYSTDNGADNDYTSLTGTSMATPNAAGSALLLQEYYGDLSGGDRMRASTLKALIIHTADDLGNPGPDYAYGWGLMNVKAAADHIQTHFDHPGGDTLVEGVLSDYNPQDTYVFTWDGVSPIKATLAWTDPAGTPTTGLDDPTPVLVNDLDLTLTQPGGGLISAFSLDPSNPSAVAVASGNTVDPVEQVLITSPTSGPGVYTLTVNHKGSLTNSRQHYSLILSGRSFDIMEVTPVAGFRFIGPQGGPFSPTEAAYTIANVASSGSLAWSASDNAAWLDLSAASGVVVPGNATDITASLNAQTEAFAEGVYVAEITFLNVLSQVRVTRNITLAIESFPEGGVIPPGWVSSMDANAGWEVTDSQASGGLYSLRNVDINDSERAGLEFMADFAAGNVSFDVKVSSEDGFDFFRFYIDGNLMLERSGDVDWQSHSFALTGGVHTLEWVYAKDGSVSEGSDTAWIDAVEFTNNFSAVPEIGVDDADGKPLADGVSQVLFTASEPGMGETKTFTIFNDGSADLTGLAITKDGPDSAAFTVGALGATTLTPGASTTFDVTFTASATNAVAAAIHIISNDADENPFDIDLIGEIREVISTESFESGLGVWMDAPGYDFTWTRNSGGTASSGTGPSAASDGSYYLYTESSDPNHPDKVAVLEAEFDLRGYATVELLFDYHMHGLEMGELYVDVYDGSWNLAVWSAVGQQQSSEFDPWIPALVDLSSHALTSGVKIRFRGVTGSNFRSDMAIDAVVLRGIPQDNQPPLITSPDTVNTQENQTFVVDVQATDDIDSEGSGLTYSLTGGVDQSQFSMDPTSGELSFITAPDFENPTDANTDNVYLVEVTVTDSGTPALTDVQVIQVTVTNDDTEFADWVSQSGNTVTEPLEDASGNGVANVMQWFLGYASPVDASLDLVPTLAPDGSGGLLFRFPLNSIAIDAGVSWEVFQSDTMTGGTWSAVDPVDTLSEPGYARVTLSPADLPVYLRLKVTPE